MALMQQHIVIVSLRSAEEICPICFTPFSPKTFPGFTTVHTPVSSKLQMFWGDILPSAIGTSFKLPKKALTAGRLNPIDRARLVDCELRRDRFPDLLRNPQSQSSPAASFSLQWLGMEIFLVLENLKPIVLFSVLSDHKTFLKLKECSVVKPFCHPR